MFYFKNGRHKTNSVCLAICVGVLALVWYLICEKWVWNNRVLDIWLTLGHIRKIALKSHTRHHLSCWCHPGSSNTPTEFYLISRTESILPSAFWFGIDPKLIGSFSDAFPGIQQPENPPWYTEAIAPCLPKVR